MSFERPVALAVQVEHLTRVFKPANLPFARQPTSEITALADISFAIPSGSLCAIVGKNGAGKSTLIRILCGLVTPSVGSVRLNGKDFPVDTGRSTGEVSYLAAEERSFYWRLSVRENLRFF